MTHRGFPTPLSPARIFRNISGIRSRVAISILCLLPGTGFSAVQFDPVFSDGMVLQRDAPVRLAGTGTPGQEVSISLDSVTQAAPVGANGTWTIELPAMKAGGPHELRAAEAATTAAVHQVLFGDVWLCSGQSNMQMGVREVVGGEKAVTESASLANVRILNMGRGGAEQPQKKCDAKWQTPTPDTIRDFSAVAWFFALNLRQDPALAKVPLGIINSSFGGTALEAWMPGSALDGIPKDQISASMFGIPSGSLYNGMIAPLTGMRVKGALWYQGEANAGRPATYSELLVKLMDQWRGGFQQPELPFFIVQLPAFEGKMGGLDFSWLREAQAIACKDTRHAWLAVTHDTTDGRDLHPIEKPEIGKRLALLARREVYGSTVVANGPRFEKLASEGGRLRVRFSSEDGLAAAGGKPPTGFSIAGDEGEYRHADVKIEGADVLLENAHIPAPRTVRYGWGGVPTGNLVNRAGLPALPFRTDEFPPDEISVQSQPVTRKIDSPRYQLSTGDGGQITSLIIQGKQFLSNEKGGGTSIPDGFGTRNFSVTEELGPRRLRMSDNSGSLEIFCTEASMEWILRNDRTDPIEFHIALNPQAKAVFSEGSVEITRDNVKLTLDGIDRLEESKVIAKISSKASTTIHLRWEP